MFQTLWESYSDSKPLFLRADDYISPSAFEYAVVARAAVAGRAILKHGVIFVDDYLNEDYGRPVLDKLLAETGYEGGLDGFVKETMGCDGADWILKANGYVDVGNSDSYIVDLRLLAALIAEHIAVSVIEDDNETLPEGTALAAIRKITGVTDELTLE